MLSLRSCTISVPHAKHLSRPLRTYTLYITYSAHYRTPRLYLSGYGPSSEPLKPQAMMEDIVGDYKDKTVTIEDFPFFDHSIKTASVHPCKHASVMKILLDRADAALKLRLAKLKAGKDIGKVDSGMEGLVDDTKLLKLTERAKQQEREESGKDKAADEWEVLEDGPEEEEVAIRVDQYLVVFLKFIARYVLLPTKIKKREIETNLLTLIVLRLASSMILRWVFNIWLVHAVYCKRLPLAILYCPCSLALGVLPRWGTREGRAQSGRLRLD